MDKILQQIERLNLSTKVNFHGALDTDKLKIVLRDSHVLALPSSYEGFGIAYLEGMGYALPAIGGRNGAAHEIINYLR